VFKGKPYKDERRIYGDKKDQIALSLEKEVNLPPLCKEEGA
jgi:hypothetical protein